MKVCVLVMWLLLTATTYAYDRRFLSSGVPIPEDKSAEMVELKQIPKKLHVDEVEGLITQWRSIFCKIPRRVQLDGDKKKLVWSLHEKALSPLKIGQSSLLTMVPALMLDNKGEPSFLPDLMVVEMHPLMLLTAALPDSLLSAFLKRYKISLEDFIKKALRNNDLSTVNFSCVVHDGTGLRDEARYVVSLHGLLTSLIKPINGAAYRTASLGMFAPMNVESQTIKTDNFGEGRVSFRYFNRFDAESATMIMPKNTKDALFWTASLMSDLSGREVLLISQHLLVKNEEIKDIFVRNNEKKLGRILELLGMLAKRSMISKELKGLTAFLKVVNKFIDRA